MVMVEQTSRCGVRMLAARSFTFIFSSPRPALTALHNLELPETIRGSWVTGIATVKLISQFIAMEQQPEHRVSSTIGHRLNQQRTMFPYIGDWRETNRCAGTLTGTAAWMPQSIVCPTMSGTSCKA